MSDRWRFYVDVPDDVEDIDKYLDQQVDEEIVVVDWDYEATREV